MLIEIGLDELMILLCEFYYPSEISIAPSLGFDNCLFITDDCSSPLAESCLYSINELGVMGSSGVFTNTFRSIVTEYKDSGMTLGAYLNKISAGEKI